MRIGILTDIHSDWDPFCRVVDHLERQGVDRLICLGDLVVHGQAHKSVVDFFRARPDIPVIKGNHDIGVTIPEHQLEHLHFFSEQSRRHTELARTDLSDENKHYLATLPLQLTEHDVLYTHATIGNPFALLRLPETIRDTFVRLTQSVMFAGHTHRTRLHHWPANKAHWCTDHPLETGHHTVELNPADRYIINVGCTAQLKYDPHPPACAVFQPHERLVHFHELHDYRRIYQLGL